MCSAYLSFLMHNLAPATGVALRRKTPLVGGVLLLLGINVLYGNRTSHRYLYGFRNLSHSPEDSLETTLHGRRPLWAKSFAHVQPYESEISPACRPHFQVASPPNQLLRWSNSSKFKRLYFYHARKAGGTSMKYYFEKVAKHHGLEFVSAEYLGSELPGSHDDSTFYVTHLRDPVARSLSHFKYEGRWDCKQLTENFTLYNASEDNANKLETWNGTAGHHGYAPCTTTSRGTTFHLVKCAVNCYTQWFSSLSCPVWDIPISTQVEKAREVLLRFNLIVILEKLKDHNYVAAIESFTGVPGLTVKRSAWCELESHEVNKKVPLKFKNETIQHLTELNRVDIDLYNNISKCLVNGVYDFPRWDHNRLTRNQTFHVDHQDFSKWKINQVKKHWEKKWEEQIRDSARVFAPTKKSPACEPHFDLATAVNTWDNETKFKRLYFYHSRKAGGSSLRYYFERVARHHGLEYSVLEYENAEFPGSHDMATFYVTNLREPVARSVSAFKYEGRWDCNQLIYNYSFVPTEANARKLESWNHTGGHHPMQCKFKGKGKPLNFFLGGCAVNCYIQWFAGICPNESVSFSQRYEIAARKILRYNFIVVIEKMSDPIYIAAVERFFGVPGITQKKQSLCESEANKANEMNPLVIQNDTLTQLKYLNKFDIMLYQRLTECLEDGNYDFPEWNETRFTSSGGRIPYSPFDHFKRNEVNEKNKLKLNLTSV
ncbi:hypothetical protein HJC23_003944 [Cyclotella cryptica]|uniref:Uncharacterized protein n=1 Tax=Cyclotella cryptica TaxID=29204 RepID=A0ABD3PV15_9STRA